MNEEQSHVLETVKRGGNIFLCGAAGTGKTTVLKEIVTWYKANNINVAITSSTGVSAISNGGKTVHSYLGIGIAQKDPFAMYMITKKKYPNTITKLRELQLLIIDEISMISSELLDKIYVYLQHVRRNKKPFGGIQVMLCGDMFQLPPVNGRYCFHSDAWKQGNFLCIELLKQMRQDGDEVFAKLLNEVRYGICSDENLELLKACKNNNNFGEIKPTILYAKNVNVDAVNAKEFEKLIDAGAERKVFATTYSKHKYSKTWAESLKIPETIELCIGCQIIITANIDVEGGIANGSRGMISGFSQDGLPIVLFKSGEQIIIEPWHLADENEDRDEAGNIMWVNFMPIRLGYALTIHKSQSMTLDCVSLNLVDIFENGQSYVSISRVKNMASMKIINVSKSVFKTSPEVIDFYDKIKNTGSYCEESPPAYEE